MEHCVFFGQTTVQTDDRCSYTYSLYTFYLCINIVKTITSLLILKQISAAANSIAAATVIPLSSVLFFWKLLAGEAYKNSITWEMMVAIIIVMVGMIIYRYKKETALNIHKVVDDEKLLTNNNIKHINT